ERPGARARPQRGRVGGANLDGDLGRGPQQHPLRVGGDLGSRGEGRGEDRDADHYAGGSDSAPAAPSSGSDSSAPSSSGASLSCSCGGSGLSATPEIL